MQSEETNVKISIIIPVYNCEKYLEQCLSSVLSQTLKELEVICIDDGSTDCSAEVIAQIAKGDTRVNLLRQSNQGAGAARNLGIGKARGKYLAFLDADDYYLDINALEIMFRTCEEYQVRAVGSRRKCLDNGTEKKEPLFEKAVSGSGKVVIYEYRDWQIDYDYQNFLFERELVTDNHIVFPVYRRFQDPPFLVKTLYAAERFAVADTYLYCYRVPNVAFRFDPLKAADLVCGLIDNLRFAQAHDLDILFQKTTDRLEYEYANIIYHNIPNDNTRMLKLLLQANEIIAERFQNPELVIRPLRMLLEKAKWAEENYEVWLRQEIREGKTIAIYGAGKMAKRFLRYLRRNDLLGKVSVILVSELNGNESRIEGIPVIAVRDYLIGRAELVLIAAGGIFHKDIIKQLEEHHVDNFEILDDVFLNKLQ